MIQAKTKTGGVRIRGKGLQYSTLAQVPVRVILGFYSFKPHPKVFLDAVLRSKRIALWCPSSPASGSAIFGREKVSVLDL